MVDEESKEPSKPSESTKEHVSHSNMIDAQMVKHDFAMSHPSANLSRETSTEIERQNINVNKEYGDAI